MMAVRFDASADLAPRLLKSTPQGGVRKNGICEVGQSCSNKWFETFCAKHVVQHFCANKFVRNMFVVFLCGLCLFNFQTFNY